MKTQISALMDGELDNQEAMSAIAKVKHEDEARACWARYHLIGDSMRGHADISSGFMTKFSARLGEEPTMLAPRAITAPRPRASRIPLSAAASIAAVMIVAWMALPIIKQSRQPIQIAQSHVVEKPVTLARETPRPEVAGNIAPVSVNDYLSAHSEFSANAGIHSGMTVIRMNPPPQKDGNR